MYVAGSDEGTDYWTLINRCRRDVGAEGLTIRGAGYLSLASADHHEPFFEDAGFKSWWTMSSAELAGFASTQGIQFAHAYTPHAGRKMKCKDDSLLYHGSCVVHELPAAVAQRRACARRWPGAEGAIRAGGGPRGARATGRAAARAAAAACA